MNNRGTYNDVDIVLIVPHLVDQGIVCRDNVGRGFPLHNIVRTKMHDNDVWLLCGEVCRKPIQLDIHVGSQSTRFAHSVTVVVEAAAYTTRRADEVDVLDT